MTWTTTNGKCNGGSFKICGFFANCQPELMTQTTTGSYHKFLGVKKLTTKGTKVTKEEFYREITHQN